MIINISVAYLGESSNSILIGKKWRVITNLEIKVDRLVGEGGKLITEAEFVGAVFRCCKGKAVILLLHFLVQGRPIRILQTTVHIIMTTSDHLENHGNVKYTSEKDAALKKTKKQNLDI